MNTLKNLPIHKQDPSAVGGINVRFISSGAPKEKVLTDNHMDDHYMFLIGEKGSALFHCDMEDFRFESKGLVLVKPYQVHSSKEVSPDVQGYHIALESFLVPDYCRKIFENLSPLQQYIKFEGDEGDTIIDTIALIYRTFNTDSPYKAFTLNGLLTAFLNQACGLYLKADNFKNEPKNQASLISAKFKELLEQYSFLHLPSFYAKKLNITTSHLNHCLNTATGLSITHWLQNAMITEAKKQIYYSNSDIKEIAYALGYEDHAYFSRLFKKITGDTPLAFRKKFRE